MKSSEHLFLAIKDFTQQYNKIQREYKEGLDALSGFEGSAKYDELSQEAAGKRDAALCALRQQASEKIFPVLDEMEKALENRPLIAPTAEQFAVLKLLETKRAGDLLTEDDCNRAVSALHGSELMPVLRKMSRESGFILHNDRLALDAGRAQEIVDSLRRGSGNYISGKGGIFTDPERLEGADITEVFSRLAGIPCKVGRQANGVDLVQFDDGAVSEFCALVDGGEG